MPGIGACRCQAYVLPACRARAPGTRTPNASQSANLSNSSTFVSLASVCSTGPTPLPAGAPCDAGDPPRGGGGGGGARRRGRAAHTPPGRPIARAHAPVGPTSPRARAPAAVPWRRRRRRRRRVEGASMVPPGAARGAGAAGHGARRASLRPTRRGRLWRPHTTDPQPL